VFGSRPLKVELWLSKDELEQEKKLKENREINQLVKVLME